MNVAVAEHAADWRPLEPHPVTFVSGIMFTVFSESPVASKAVPSYYEVVLRATGDMESSR